MRVCTVVLVALAPALALAAPKRLPGDAHVPRLVADPGITSFYIQSHDTDYTLVANFLVVGGDKTGKLRMDARAHGTVHSAACEMSPVASGVSGNCRIVQAAAFVLVSPREGDEPIMEILQRAAAATRAMPPGSRRAPSGRSSSGDFRR